MDNNIYDKKTIKIIEGFYESYDKFLSMKNSYESELRPKLPVLKNYQRFICYSCSSDVVEIEKDDYNAVEIRNPEGEIVAKIAVKGWRTKCCKEGFSIWDEKTNQEIEIEWED